MNDDLPSYAETVAQVRLLTGQAARILQAHQQMFARQTVLEAAVKALLLSHPNPKASAQCLAAEMAREEAILVASASSDEMVDAGGQLAASLSALAQHLAHQAAGGTTPPPSP